MQYGVFVATVLNDNGILKISIDEKVVEQLKLIPGERVSVELSIVRWK